MMILRWDVPIDDRPHSLPLTGEVVHVDCREVVTVEVWTLDTGGPPRARVFQVVGTGQPFPDGWQHRGTTMAAGGRLVWHLMEVPS